MKSNDLIELIKTEYSLDIDLVEKSNESTDGNVYIISTINNELKFVVKIYTDIEHANTMTKLHSCLKKQGVLAPDVIKNNEGDLCTKVSNNVYVVCYSFIQGRKLKEVELTNYIIKDVACYLRRLHDIKNNRYNLKEIPFEINSNRHSVLHFDVTKNNIFLDVNNNICFIDFDDAKFGPSVCDIAIALTNLFISKANGIDTEGMKLFIDSYYRDDKLLKEAELPIIKDAATKWLKSIMNNQNFDTSTKLGLDNKLNCWNEITLENLT